jgi:hypothetical protein
LPSPDELAIVRNASQCARDRVAHLHTTPRSIRHELKMHHRQDCRQGSTPRDVYTHRRFAASTGLGNNEQLERVDQQNLYRNILLDIEMIVRDGRAHARGLIQADCEAGITHPPGRPFKFQGNTSTRTLTLGASCLCLVACLLVDSRCSAAAHELAGWHLPSQVQTRDSMQPAVPPHRWWQRATCVRMHRACLDSANLS